MDDVKFMIEDDGQIVDAEKRILNTMREKYGISDVRAAEIVNSLLKSTEAEAINDYINEVKNIIAQNGQIGETERRALDFFREKLNISPEKAAKLEQFVLKN